MCPNIPDIFLSQKKKIIFPPSHYNFCIVQWCDNDDEDDVGNIEDDDGDDDDVEDDVDDVDDDDGILT